MPRKLFFLILPLLGLAVFAFTRLNPYGAPPYFPDDTPDPSLTETDDNFANWQRPEGPLRVGLQAGHWQNADLPEELARLRPNTGSSGLGVAEWQVNLTIAQLTKELLEKQGIVVDILPATIPPDYYADAFVAIHADGSLDRSVRGYKVAAPRRTRTQLSQSLGQIIEDIYGQNTGFRLDPNISRNMTGYYAFNWRRFEHSIHPMTPAVILETGFLTNNSDARILIDNPQLPAAALAQAITHFISQNYPELYPV